MVNGNAIQSKRVLSIVDDRRRWNVAAMTHAEDRHAHRMTHVRRERQQQIRLAKGHHIAEKVDVEQEVVHGIARIHQHADGQQDEVGGASDNRAEDDQ